MPKVNTEILKWARKAAGLSEEEAAKRLGLSGPDRLVALESGARDPSRRQLLNMSERYRRPLLTFYMPTRPQRSDKGQDFRTLPEEPTPSSEALLDALLRNVQARQGLVRAALEEAEEDEPLSFVGSADMGNGVDRLVTSMQEAIGFSAGDFRAKNSVTSAFSALRGAVEKAGVFVLLMGNLGTHHTDIEARIFRGFALADKVAPFIVINENDSRAAWSFTLLHELAHVFLGETGVSGYDGDAEVEKFCDSVAARFLLDSTELVEIGVQYAAGIDDLVNRIGSFAGGRNLSRKMVAYNLLRSGHITPAIYRELNDTFDSDRLASRKKGREEKGGPDYYMVRRHRVGPALIGFVNRMVADGALSMTKAAKVLGTKPTAVDRLLRGNHAA